MSRCPTRGAFSLGRLSAVPFLNCWQAVAAVKAKRVYLSPRLPFGWVDHPTSVNRLLGLKWLPQVFYPDVFKGDIRAQAHEFYRLFYQIELSEAQLDTLLANARR